MEIIRPPCAWCRGPIPATARRDSKYCCKSHRQAAHRFGRQVGRAAAATSAEPRRLAYADPPYPGKAVLYRGHPDYAGEVDHAALMAELVTFDGWALSTSAAALATVLPLCPPGARVAAWHRGPRAGASWAPLSAWEPVIYWPARPVDPARPGGAPADSLSCGVTALTTLPSRVIGAKPAPVCRWIFDLLGAAPADDFLDMFPGSGAVGHAWRVFSGASPGSARDASRAAAAHAFASAAPDASHAAGADASTAVGFDPCGLPSARLF